MTVRVATPADREAIYWQLMNDLQADNGLGWQPSPAKVFAHVESCCGGERGIAGVIDGPDGGIIASIGVELTTPWYSDDWFLIQVWQFVLPEHRGGTSHAEDLFSFAETHRQYIGAQSGRDIVLETTVMSRKRLAAKSRLWRKHGKWIGSMYWSGDNVQVE